MKRSLCQVCVVVLLLVIAIDSNLRGAPGERSGPIYNGPELDYQPSIIRLDPSGDLMLVYERIDVASFFGDLYVCFSNDNGQTWTTPQPIIDTPLNERHPALIQLGADSYAVFYLVDETGSGAYRIHRATSSDGLSWTSHGAVDLGWSSSGEINPDVLVEADGSLIMSYQRLSNPVYIARSLDSGASWDRLKTQVSGSTAALPRIAKRESDGVYLVTYQTGSSSVDIWSKTTTDPYVWPSTATPFSTAINSHDSQPIVLEGGTFLVTYAQQVASVFDLHYRTSYDGETWSDEVRVTNDVNHYDTQPHPLLQGTPGRVILAWSHQESSTPYVDHDVWVDDNLLIALPLWLDVDTIPASSGGIITFSLDAGSNHGGRNYLLAASKSGTTPGTILPGGATIPLNRDTVTDYVLAHLNNWAFVDFWGALDNNGQATATLNWPYPLSMAVGTILNFAYITANPYDFQSNPVGVAVVP